MTTIKNAKDQTTQASPANVSDSIAMASKQQETAKQQTTDKQITVALPTPAYNQVNAQLASAKKLPTKIATQQNIEPSHIAVSNKTAVTAPQNTTENDVTLVAKKSSKNTSKQTLNNANSASKKQIEALTNAASQPLETSPIWRNAKQLKTVNPIYPSLAKRKGIEIDVQVDFTIDVNGDIKNIQFARQNKLNYFKSSIRSAIKQWRFVPAKVDDQPVESQMTKVFSFNLQS